MLHETQLSRVYQFALRFYLPNQLVNPCRNSDIIAVFAQNFPFQFSTVSFPPRYLLYYRTPPPSTVPLLYSDLPASFVFFRFLLTKYLLPCHSPHTVPLSTSQTNRYRTPTVSPTVLLGSNLSQLPSFITYLSQSCYCIPAHVP